MPSVASSLSSSELAEDKAVPLQIAAGDSGSNPVVSVSDPIPPPSPLLEGHSMKDESTATMNASGTINVGDSTTAASEAGAKDASNSDNVVHTAEASPAAEPITSSPPPTSTSLNPLKERLKYSMQYVEYVWKREVALLRYYGFVQYVRNQYRDLIHARLFTTLDASLTDATTTSTTGARVPFVMTVKMRTELMEHCGYAEEEIRQLTPQQAHAILEKERRRSGRTIVDNPPPPTQQTVDEFHAATDQDAQSVSEFLQESNPVAPNATAAALDNSSSDDASVASDGSATTTWYEIVEEVSTDDAPPQVVAMYLNEKDAEYGLSIYEELAQRKQVATSPPPLPSYHIRTTRK